MPSNSEPAWTCLNLPLNIGLKEFRVLFFNHTNLTLSTLTLPKSESSEWDDLNNNGTPIMLAANFDAAAFGG